MTAMGRRLRGVLLPVTLVACTLFFGAVVHRHYPIGQWLFWRYATAWAYALLFASACLLFGSAIVRRALPLLGLRECALLGFAIGVYVFFLGLFTAGVLGIFGPPIALLLPLSMLLAGAWSLRKVARRTGRHLAAWWRRPRQRLPVAALPVLLYGVLAVGLVYFGSLNPKNASFDSVWYHLGLGEQWAAEGAIHRSPEGWFVAALPQLAATLYSWAFLVPHRDLFDVVEIAAHLELVMFLATLAGVPLLVRWLVPRSRAGLAWVAMLLFPALFVYDANLSVGNDHVAAFWAIPIFSTLRRAWRRLDIAPSLLFAVCCAGALLTKYQAASLVAVPALALTARALWLGTSAGRGLAVAAVSGLALTAPHWLKNWLWYGDPLYPALGGRLSARPWHPDLPALIASNYERLLKRPQGTPLEQLGEAVLASFRFSFRSHARPDLHGALPIFGSLFTLSLILLVALRAPRRVWALAAAAQAGVVVWYLISHVERYLQALVPWMAAVVAATVVLAWRRGTAARIGVGALVTLQAVWGADAFFFPTHSMLGTSPIVATAELLASGYRRDFAARSQFGGALQQIGETAPRDAKLLLHEHNPRLGLGGRVVTDMADRQGLINYGRLASRRELHDLYATLGVTHVVWRTGESRGLDSLAADLRFFDYVENHTNDRRVVGGLSIARIRQAPPPALAGQEWVAVFACGIFEPGLHRLAALHVLSAALPATRVPAARSPADVAAARFVVHDPTCPDTRLPVQALRGFVRVALRGREQLYVRRDP